MNKIFGKSFFGRFGSLAGFTLMELMIVIAIIIILSGAIVSRVSSSSDKAKDAKARLELEQIATACRSFYTDTGLWPKTLANLVAPISTAPGTAWNELRVSTTIPAGYFRGPYLESTTVPKDPWGTAYVLDYITILGQLNVRCGSISHTTTSLLVHIFQA